MRKARPKVGPARLVFKHSILDPFLIENVLEEGCGLNFVTGRIGGVDAQIVLHPLQRQVGVSGQAIGWHRAEASADVEAAAGLAAAGRSCRWRAGRTGHSECKSVAHLFRTSCFPLCFRGLLQESLHVVFIAGSAKFTRPRSRAPTVRAETRYNVVVSQ